MEGEVKEDPPASTGVDEVVAFAACWSGSGFPTPSLSALSRAPAVRSAPACRFASTGKSSLPSTPDRHLLEQHRPDGKRGRSSRVAYAAMAPASARAPHTCGTTMLDGGADLRDVHIGDPRTAMRCDRARKNVDRHANYILAAYMVAGT